MYAEGEVINLLRHDSFKQMYKINDLEVFMDHVFMENFSNKHPNLVELIKEWWDDACPFTEKYTKSYKVQFILRPYRLLMEMLCCLNGLQTST